MLSKYSHSSSRDNINCKVTVNNNISDGWKRQRECKINKIKTFRPLYWAKLFYLLIILAFVSKSSHFINKVSSTLYFSFYYFHMPFSLSLRLHFCLSYNLPYQISSYLTSLHFITISQAQKNNLRLPYFLQHNLKMFQVEIVLF